MLNVALTTRSLEFYESILITYFVYDIFDCYQPYPLDCLNILQLLLKT